MIAASASLFLVSCVNERHVAANTEQQAPAGYTELEADAYVPEIQPNSYHSRAFHPFYYDESYLRCVDRILPGYRKMVEEGGDPTLWRDAPNTDVQRARRECGEPPAGE